MTTRRLAGGVLLALTVTLAGGCSSHDGFCRVGRVTCVEACGGEPFLQCGGCPDGSVPADECGDAGP